MIVMFSDNAVLILAIVDADIERIRGGLTLEYIDPPHDPQLVKNIVVMHGVDKEDVIRQLKAGGANVTDAVADAYRSGKRTDRGHRSN